MHIYIYIYIYAYIYINMPPNNLYQIDVLLVKIKMP